MCSKKEVGKIAALQEAWWAFQTVHTVRSATKGLITEETCLHQPWLSHTLPMGHDVTKFFQIGFVQSQLHLLVNTVTHNYPFKCTMQTGQALPHKDVCLAVLTRGPASQVFVLFSAYSLQLGSFCLSSFSLSGMASCFLSASPCCFPSPFNLSRITVSHYQIFKTLRVTFTSSHYQIHLPFTGHKWFCMNR